MTILIDTSVVFGFANTRDQRHDEAARLMQSVAKQRWGAPRFSPFVVAETLTLLRARLKDERSERRAKRLLPLPDSLLPGCRVLPLTSADMQAAWDAFDRYRDARLSFADAAQVAAIEAGVAGHLATFDRRLAALVPSVP